MGRGATQRKLSLPMHSVGAIEGKVNNILSIVSPERETRHAPQQNGCSSYATSTGLAWCTLSWRRQHKFPIRANVIFLPSSAAAALQTTGLQTTGSGSLSHEKTPSDSLLRSLQARSQATPLAYLLHHAKSRISTVRNICLPSARLAWSYC